MNMKNKLINKIVVVTIFLVTISFNLHAQGTIDFDHGGHYYPVPGPTPGTPFYNYTEKGFLFQVIIPTLGTTRSPYYDNFGIVSAGFVAANSPYNSTAYLTFVQYASPDDYVSFSQTSSEAFGLISVDLATMVPALVNYAVTFLGTKADGAIVEQDFSVTAGGTWDTYYFNSDFASDLVSVDILAPRLLMDNIVFIPEPGTTALVALGLLACWRTLRKRKFCQ